MSSTITNDSMTNYNRVLSLVAMLLTAALVAVGCTTEVDYTMGEEFIPEQQKMEMRHRTYRAGEMMEGSTTVAMPLSATHLYMTDSIPSANMVMGYFGKERSDIYGNRTAGFMTQMLFGLSLDEERGWGYRPIFDSMTMSLYITNYHGDTTHKQRFEVYEITSNDYFRLPEDKDTSFYINFDPTPYISSEPIFEFTFPNQERGIYVGDIENPEECIVRLEETPATAEYIERLMLLTDLDDNGGYALDTDGLYVVGNELAFLDKVRGIYIKPAEDNHMGEGAMFATQLEKSYLRLYARGRYEEDPTIIRDTTDMTYCFYIDPEDYDVKAGNVSINTVQHDLSAVSSFNPDVIEQHEEVLIGYVDGMGGVVTELTFSDELIQSLADIALDHEDAVVSVNQAHLTIYLEGSAYDYTTIDPMYITPLLNAAMPRMGLYTNYAQRISVTDYAYSKEGSYTLAFDGNINRSRGCYTMDISSYIQSLMMAARDNLLEDGKTVNLDKFSAGYTPEEESLVQFRHFYIAPTVDGLFGMDRQAIIGGDGEVNGKSNESPITLEITYTIVR